MSLTYLDIINPVGKYIRPLRYLLDAEANGWDTSRRTMTNKFDHRVIQQLITNGYIHHEGNNLEISGYTKRLLARHI